MMAGPWQLLLSVTVLLTLASIVGVAVVIYAAKSGCPSRPMPSAPIRPAFCGQCGAALKGDAAVCVKCGCAVVPVQPSGVDSSEWTTAMLLCGFLGCFGAHRFYTRDVRTGVLQLVLGLFSCFLVSLVWATVDFVQLMNGTYRTGDGRILKNV